jgi:hypothetical protein
MAEAENTQTDAPATTAGQVEPPAAPAEEAKEEQPQSMMQSLMQSLSDEMKLLAMFVMALFGGNREGQGNGQTLVQEEERDLPPARADGDLPPVRDGAQPMQPSPVTVEYNAQGEERITAPKEFTLEAIAINVYPADNERQASFIKALEQAKTEGVGGATTYRVDLDTAMPNFQRTPIMQTQAQATERGGR